MVRLRRAAALTVIALAAAAGSAVADPIPQLPVPPPQYAGTVTDTNVPIPMSDGVNLLADVFRPAGAGTTRFPVIVTMTPYNKTVFDSIVADGTLVRHGYVQVVVDVRGTGSSPGSWESFGAREQQDFVEVLAWARQQPWSNGVLGTAGPSYMAINQLLVAERRPAGLKAIFPIVPGGDLYRDVVYHGGELDAGFIPLWLGLVKGAGLVPPTSGELPWLTSLLTQSASFPAQAITQGLTGGDLAFDGPFYQLRDPLTHIDQINVPTFVIGGWWDLFQRSEPFIYQQLRLPPGQKQLLMGPWYHATPFVSPSSTGLADGPDTPQSFDDLQILWFDHWLKGINNGIGDYGPVTVYQLGASTWRREQTWPPPVNYQRMYLAPGASGSLAGTLQPDPPSAGGSVTIQPNPAWGVCSRSLVQWTAGLANISANCTSDNATAEQGAATFTTAPVQTPTQISGPLDVHLRGSTSTRDGYWVADITDVGPDGHSTQVTSGWLLMSRRALDPQRSVRTASGDLAVPFHPFTQDSLLPVTPGTPYDLDIEVFGTNLVLEPGHSLRLVLRTNDSPHALPTVPDQLNLLGAVQTVDLTPNDPSYVTVPFVDRTPAHIVKVRVKGHRVYVTVDGPGVLRIGKCMFDLAGAKTVSCAARLTRAARQRLEHKHHVTIKVGIAFVPAVGGTQDRRASVRFRAKR